MGKEFQEVRVVSRDFVRDWFQGIRSFFGMRLKAYEDRASETIKELMKGIKKKGKIDWYRMNIQEISDGILINIYGEYK